MVKLSKLAGFGCFVAVLLGLTGASPAAEETQAGKYDASKPRLVMVKVDHWKVGFFHLPGELPVLIPAGAVFDKARKVYDFEEGMEAMEVFLQALPKDKWARTFRVFLEKWPLYQEFFKAVDAEAFERARGLMTKILALDPLEPAAHFYSGSLHSQAGEYALAETEYRKCLEYFPGYGPAYINLARLAMARQDKREAERWLRQALEKSLDNDQSTSRHLAEQMLENLKKP
jgi:tetratricopeptide (TPR) repeat protein